MDQDANTIGYSARVARWSMNRLVLACKDDIMAEEDARSAVRDGALAAELGVRARERALFVEDLQRAILSLGGNPSRRASPAAWARSLVRHVRAFVGGPHEGDAYAAITHADERTARAYLHALSRSLPDDARFGVKQQLAWVEADRDEARALWGMH
jgi:uncharacterized protein (TIGR02284 family)